MDEREQAIQESQYEFPYHHIPSWGEHGFDPARRWRWSDRYLAGLRVVLDHLEDTSFRSLVDVGCGDGRLLAEIRRRFPDARLSGVDVSSRALAFARAFNPDVEFREEDIVEGESRGQADVATCVEVLEHIPPVHLEAFVAALARQVREEGRVIVTVPHVNQRRSAKHYRHFSESDLRSLLGREMTVERVIPFDVRSKMVSALRRVFLGDGRFFAITNRRLLGWYLDIYFSRFLYADGESKASRLAAVCRVGTTAR